MGCITTCSSTIAAVVRVTRTANALHPRRIRLLEKAARVNVSDALYLDDKISDLFYLQAFHLKATLKELADV
jgi:cob(I)alamin adenosyltransferase